MSLLLLLLLIAMGVAAYVALGATGWSNKGRAQASLGLVLVFLMTYCATRADDPVVAGMKAAENAQIAQRVQDANIQAQAERAVRATLRDPESAQFQSVVVVRKPGSIAVCGEVNARNGFGGYTGFTSFMARGTVAAINNPPSDEFVTLWNRACVTP